VVADRKSVWARRRRIDLDEIVDQKWMFPAARDLQQEGHMAIYIRRRELISTLGAAAAWPLAARAQQLGLEVPPTLLARADEVIE
jgi:hypothetical protein